MKIAIYKDSNEQKHQNHCLKRFFNSYCISA